MLPLHFNATDCTGLFKCCSLCVFVWHLLTFCFFTLLVLALHQFVNWCNVHLSIGDLGSGEISSHFFLSAHQLCPSCNFHLQLLSSLFNREFPELPKSSAGFKCYSRTATTFKHTGQARFVHHITFYGSVV